jgi:hypothetical protein
MARATKKKKVEYLSPSERESLEVEKQELKATLREMKSSGSGTQAEQIDRDRLKKEIDYLDHAIDVRTPKEPRGVAKDKLAKEERELEEAIAEGMPTRFEMRRPSQNPGAVRKHMSWSQRNAQRINRYREIQRLLRPLEPKSIESLRKDR